MVHQPLRDVADTRIQLLHQELHPADDDFQPHRLIRMKEMNGVADCEIRQKHLDSMEGEEESEKYATGIRKEWSVSFKRGSHKIGVFNVIMMFSFPFSSIVF